MGAGGKARGVAAPLSVWFPRLPGSRSVVKGSRPYRRDRIAEHSPDPTAAQSGAKADTSAWRTACAADAARSSESAPAPSSCT